MFEGVVLCGGESSRMGRDKALLPIDGVPMAVRVASALHAAGATTVRAIGGDEEGLVRAGLVVEPDRAPGGGPFPATIQALREAREEIVLVVSCDLVAPSPDAMRTTVERLAGDPAALLAVPLSDGHRQWTHTAWRTSALPALEAAWEAGARSLRRAGADLRLAEVTELDPAALVDADSPADLPGRDGPLAAGGSLRPMDVPAIDVTELAARREAGAPLIDVREDDEYAEARVPGAHHIPLGEVSDRVAEVPTEGTVYVICAKGGRSAKAVEHYRSLGIDAVNVAGGTLGWIDAGLPTDSGSGGL